MSEKLTKKAILSTINGAFTIEGSVEQVMKTGEEFEKFMEDLRKEGLKIKHYRYDVNLSDKEEEN
jgi:hypothetical protein